MNDVMVSDTPATPSNGQGADTVPVLEARGLTIRYGTNTAINDVSFAVPERQITAIIGPSGCGKSTLLRILAGLDEPSMGLAPILVEDIFRVVRQLNREGTTILLVEQNALMALSVAKRGYVLETGEVVLAGTAGELQENPQVQEAYLGGG